MSLTCKATLLALTYESPDRTRLIFEPLYVSPEEAQALKSRLGTSLEVRIS